MASISFLAISPSALLTLIGLLHGPDKTIPTPTEDWREAKVDVLIPAYCLETSLPLSLVSLAKQTFKPRQIIIIDDASTDSTHKVTESFIELLDLGIPIKLIRNETTAGKTPSLKKQAYESDADVLFVLDGDTILVSENYLERVVEELYKGIGNAAACGKLFPMREKDRDQLISDPFCQSAFQTLYKEYPYTNYYYRHNLLQRFGRFLTNTYRESLYKFLQGYIYRGEMVFFGTLINPIGCAVAYRRTYLKDMFEKNASVLGVDLTTSEDVFIGFSFSVQGYKNIQIKDVCSRTLEPVITKIYKQTFLWSSAYLQSCYYLSSILWTPFKSVQYYLSKKKGDRYAKEIAQKRKIQEAYRQPFGESVTEKFGRPIGWFIFAGLFEKITYPFILFLFLILRKWEVLFITMSLEIFFFGAILSILSKGNRVSAFFKSILIAPLRYTIFILDAWVVLWFLMEITFKQKKTWRK